MCSSDLYLQNKSKGGTRQGKCFIVCNRFKGVAILYSGYNIKRHIVAIYGNLWQSMAIYGNLWQSVANLVITQYKYCIVYTVYIISIVYTYCTNSARFI